MRHGLSAGTVMGHCLAETGECRSWEKVSIFNMWEEHESLVMGVGDSGTQSLRCSPMIYASWQFLPTLYQGSSV